MLIYVGEPHYNIITVQEGSGDNLDATDEANGYVDYFMSSVYKQDGDELELVDGGQILTSVLISDMEEMDVLKTIFDYWELGDPEDRDADYVILER